MALYRFICKNCSAEVMLFSHEIIQCNKCQSTDLEKLRSVPLKTKNLERLEQYHNVQAIPGIKEDIKERNRRHTNANLKETIDEFGKNIAKEQGWIKKDGKVRNDMDDQ